MDCETAKGLLSSYFDGELDPARRKRVAEHVENCSACSREFDGLAKLDRDSRLMSLPEPPPEMWDRIESRLAVRETALSALSGAFGRRQLLVAIGAVAVSALGVFATSMLGHRNQKHVAPELVQPIQHRSIAPNAVLADLSEISPQDLRLIEIQQICASDVCNDRLGSSGEPIKLVLQNKTVLFVCSPGCEQWVREHPLQALAKVRILQIRHLKSSHSGRNQ
jgi:hypothetical protein